MLVNKMSEIPLSFELRIKSARPTSIHTELLEDGFRLVKVLVLP